MKKYYLKLFCFVLPIGLIAQNTKKDTIMVGLSIPEIIFAEEKEEGERLLSPNRIEKIDAIDIFQDAPTSSADILQKSGAVAVQMSHSGGGSPI